LPFSNTLTVTEFGGNQFPLMNNKPEAKKNYRLYTLRLLEAEYRQMKIPALLL